MNEHDGMSIVLLVRALERGGAEGQLLALAKGLHQRGHRVHVVSFYAGGPLAGELERSGVPFRHAAKGGRWDLAGFVVRLLRLLRELRPQVVFSSMPAANIASQLLSPLARGPAVVWRLASSDMRLTEYDWFSRLSYRVEAMLARLPRLIIANAEAGRRAALSRGYPSGRLRVVPNGIDTRRFARDPAAGARLRAELGLPAAGRVVGQVARSDPKKDYTTFVAAAAMLAGERSDVSFLCVGAASGADAGRLQAMVEEKGLSARLVLTPMQDDVVPCYSAMDIATLSSAFGEGFPNCVAEAMACGAPCAVTDVGDAARIVGELGEVAPPRSPQDLCAAWRRLLERMETGGEALRRRARDRVASRYGLEAYVAATERLLRDALS